MKKKSLINILILTIITIGFFKSNYTHGMYHLSNDSLITQGKEQINYPENFQTFVKKFFSDSTFQKDRILSPLQVYDLDRKRLWSVILKEPVDTLKIVFGNKWKFHRSFATDTLQYEVQIKYARNQVIYVERGTDFGLSTIYKFKIINKQWFLVRIEYINI